MDISRRIAIPGIAFVAILVGVVGGSLINAFQANAATISATTPSTSQGSTSPNTQTPPDPSRGGHVGANGTKEVLLTGETAEKVKAAALAAVPGGTILRVETDAEGATYEAHMTKSDGSQVTVKLDSNFKVTNTEDGIR
jgi:hypothetical protein